METTKSFGTLPIATDEGARASADVTLAAPLQACLMCGETPVAATRTACPYCGTALPLGEAPAHARMWVDVGAD